MVQGLRSAIGVAAPPFTRGPYTWDQQVTFTAGLSGANTPGSCFYVDPQGITGNDNNDGKSWATALKSVQAAVNKCGDRLGDIIFVGPGKIQENVLVEKNHDAISIIAVKGPWETQWRPGDGLSGPGAVLNAFTDSGGDGFNSPGIGLFIGARSVVVDGFCFDGGGGYTGMVIGDGYGVANTTQGTSQNAASCRVRNCLFRAGNEGTNIPALVLKGCSDNVIIENNEFRTCCIGVYISPGSGKTNQAPIIRGNLFTGNVAYGVYKHNENTDLNVQVLGNTFLDGSSQTMTYAVKMQGTGVHFVAGNRFACANTFSAAATDFQSGNFKPQAGNSVKYVAVET